MESNAKDLFEDVPAEIIGLISANLKFKDFNTLLSSNSRLRKLLARNELWREQIIQFFQTTAYINNQNCQEIFQKIYVNRFRFEAGSATTQQFKSQYVPLKVISSDGGDYSEYFGVANLVIDELERVYCTTTEKSENINIVLAVENEKPSFIRTIKIQGPQGGYTAPIDEGLIFLFDEMPDLKQLTEFDGFARENWTVLSELFENNVESLKKAKCPVAFFDKLGGIRMKRGGDWRTAYINFDFPFPVAKYIVLKMLRASGDQENIDIASFIVYGGSADEIDSNIRSFETARDDISDSDDDSWDSGSPFEDSSEDDD